MNLNGKPSNPGELRVPISLQGPTIATDEGGAQRASWANLTDGDVKAKWVNVHGVEAWAAGQAGKATAAATVTIRYRSDVTSRCTILKGIKQYRTVVINEHEVQQEIPRERWEIVSPDNIQERNEYLELKVRRVTGTV